MYFLLHFISSLYFYKDFPSIWNHNDMKLVNLNGQSNYYKLDKIISRNKTKLVGIKLRLTYNHDRISCFDSQSQNVVSYKESAVQNIHLQWCMKYNDFCCMEIH